MRILGVMMVAALVAASPARAQWSDVEGGRKHDKSGLVCPTAAGRFTLNFQVATDIGLSCGYTLECPDAAGCGGAVGSAWVAWNTTMDFAERFRSRADRAAQTVVDEPGPDWAGPPRLVSRGADAARGGWWVLTPHGQPLNVSLFYNPAAEADAHALLDAVVKANP